MGQIIVKIKILADNHGRHIQQLAENKTKSANVKK